MRPVKRILIFILVLSGITWAAIAQQPQQNRLARDTDKLVPGAPSPEQISDPQSAPVKKSVNYWRGSLGPYNCSNGPDGIVCFLLITSKDAGAEDYHVTDIAGDAMIIDNFHLPHKVIRSYLLDGLGGAQEVLNLSQGDIVWWVLVFEAGPKPIREARLILRYAAQQFQVPVH